MDPDFWLQRWQENKIGFHRDNVQDLLSNHWGKLNIVSSARVFVPLCGKSLDMAWLAEQGHYVIGAELSEHAIDAFFNTAGLTPIVEQIGDFLIKRTDKFELWCGDIFEMPDQSTQSVEAVYDRASLIALPIAARKRYVNKIQEIAPSAKTLLISLAYNEEEMDGPPFSVPETEVQSLYSPTHAIDVAQRRRGIGDNDNLRERGLTDLEESCYLLTPKP